MQGFSGQAEKLRCKGRDGQVCVKSLMNVNNFILEGRQKSPKVLLPPIVDMINISTPYTKTT